MNDQNFKISLTKLDFHYILKIHDFFYPRIFLFVYVYNVDTQREMFTIESLVIYIIRILFRRILISFDFTPAEDTVHKL